MNKDNEIRGQPTRTNPAPWAAPDCRLAPGPRVQRSLRGGQPPRKAGGARRVRFRVVPELPDFLRQCPVPAFSPGIPPTPRGTYCSEPPGPKCQEAAGFSIEIAAGCARRNLVVTSALAWGGST